MPTSSPRPRAHDAAALSDTRARLLDAAGRIFAERGYRAATIREIVDLAGANVAAVHYHFGDKERLYEEALASSCHVALLGDDLPAGSAEGRLHCFVLRFLQHLLGQDKSAWPARLRAREMLEPTPALQVLADRVMRPTMEGLAGLLCELSPAPLTEQQAWMAAHSVLAQCVAIYHGDALLQRLGGPFPQGPERLEVLAGHITRFSVAAVRGYAATQVSPPSSGRPAPCSCNGEPT